MNKNKIFLFFLILFLIICSIVIYRIIKFSSVENNSHTLSSIILFGSLSLTIIFFIIITQIFGILKYKHWLFDFIIGEQGTYSLSRLQAVLWALVIIGNQISIIIAIILNPKEGSFQLYQPVFSESSLWLLALSLSNSIIVKGITINQISQSPNLYRRKVSKAKWSDLLVNDNGLDFSRCQMLIWTLLAIFVYMSKSFYYLNSILISNGEQLSILFHNSYDDSTKISSDVNNVPYIPYLPWSFIVLMGLSQGAYVGKKLIPTFKLDDIKLNKQKELKSVSSQLEYKKNLLTQVLSKTSGNSNTALDIVGIKNLKDQILEIENKIIDLNNDIEQIDKSI
jgi:hypothetical protein